MSRLYFDIFTNCIFNKKLFTFGVGKAGKISSAWKVIFTLFFAVQYNEKIRKMKNTVVFIIVVGALLVHTKSFSQNIAPQDMEKFHIMEDSMLVTSDSMFDAFIPDTHTFYSERFAKQLVRTLKIPNSYYYPFDKLKEKINLIYADDNNFRIFNWEILTSKEAKRYYGAIQLPGEKLKLYGLLDYSEEMGKGAEDSILSNGKWFGALYYRIMSNDYQGRKIYTLFGLNSGNIESNKKVLDPLTIDEHGITFGAPIFGVASENFPRQRINRFILEYKKGVMVSMNWDKDRNVIIFDKLVSQVNDPHRKYTYVPSGEYDGFSWHDETWNYMQDLIPVTIMKEGQEPPGEDK